MPVRVEKDPMGMSGRAFFVESPEDLPKLPKQAAKLVDPRTEAIFRDVKGSLARMAADAPLPAMARWLRSLTAAPCALEIFAMRFGNECRLRFHFDDRWAPSFRPAVGTARVACPSIIEAVQAVTGSIDFQWGCSGTLVALGELETFRELVTAQRVLNFELLAPLLKRDRKLGAYAGIYEADGDYLCASTTGQAFWAGGEWTGEAMLPAELSLTTILERYFDALTERRHFRPGQDG